MRKGCLHMSAKRCLMVGAGGFARAWLQDFLAPFYGDRLQVVALVDVNEQVLARSADLLGLPAERRFRDIETAFASVDADFCIIVIPPAVHELAVQAAVARGMPILSEKPIADTWEACTRIYRSVKAAGVKMAVIQNYRYSPPILALKQVLDSGRLGRINYVMGRFAGDYSQRGSWADWRHEIAHALLIEGAVHHFDQLRNLSGSDCHCIAGWEWNPPWSSFDGECCAQYVMKMASGVICHYEGSLMAKGKQNNWHSEYYRVECENGAVEVDNDHVVRIYEHEFGRGLRVEELPPAQVEYDNHKWIINEFLNWLDGGPAPTTELDDNIKSAALMFAALDASSTNQVVDVAAKVAATIG